MSYLNEKVAFIKGLFEGMDFDQSSKEGKLFSYIIDALDELADTVTMVDEDLDDLADFVEAMDEDLGELEEEIFDLDEEDLEEFIDFDEVDCPNCGESIFLDEDIIDDLEDNCEVEINCPVCNQVIELAEDEVEDGCCCD